jgi:putative ABC transport system permease protein
MNPSPIGPPRLTAALLAWMLPDDPVGQSIQGDLDQEYRQRIGWSLLTARRWYRREALSVVIHRILAALLPVRSRGRHQLPWGDNRAQKGDPMLQVLWQDVRYTVRALARSPRFTVVAAVTLALGIGAATAVFSAVNGVLLKPLPYPGSERIVGLWHGAPDLGYNQFGISPGVFYEYSNGNEAYEAMGLYFGLERNLTEDGDAERVPATGSTAGLFDVLGVPPLLGRTYTAEEACPGGAGVAVLSYGLWQRRYGGDPAIVGRTMHLDGSPTEIIGVMPPGFDFGGPKRKTELWLPLHTDLANGDPGIFSFSAVARLKPGVTAEAALAQEKTILQRVRERWANETSFIGFLDAGGFHPIVHTLQEEVVGDMQRPLWILLGTVAIVLLIACANVANLFLVRAEGRQREIAIRAAMGATRGRLAGGFLLESLMLAGLGGILGWTLAWLGTPLLLRVAPPELPRLDQITLDGTVMGFTLGLTLLSALLFGIVPALRYDVAGLLGVLRSAGRGSTEARDRHRLRNLLVVAQTALAMVLLVGSGLLVKSFWEIRRTDPGFDTRDLLTFRISLPNSTYRGAERPARFHQQLLERLRALPGVEAAGGVSELPLSQNPTGTAFDIEDLPTPAGQLPPMFWYKYTTPGYFEAMGISVVAGRAFEQADHEQSLGNIIVSRALADRLWPGQEVLGKRVRIDGDTTATGWERIVGVVENTRDLGLRKEPLELVYHPLVGPHVDGSWSIPRLSYVIRARNPMDLVAGVREAVREMDPNLPLAGIQTMESVMAESILQLTFTALALGIAAVMALILGAVGLYGVLSYVVSQRTREIGVRIALGARTGQVLGMVVTSGVKLTLLGLVLGLVGAGALTRLLQELLFGTKPLDPVTFAGMSLVLLGVSLLASWLPARRAAGVDPVQSMRME